MEENSLMDFVNGGITLIVGLVAYVVYLLSKRTEKTNAAMILLMDIRNAERTSRALATTLTNGRIDVRPVMAGEDNWKKYQHLFASILNQDELLAFNNFFECCNAIAECQKISTEVLYTSFKAKAEVMQQVILSPEFVGPENILKRNSYLEKANLEPFTFDPQDPKNRMRQALAELGVMSTTTAFERLKKISQPKWYELW